MCIIIIIKLLDIDMVAHLNYAHTLNITYHLSVNGPKIDWRHDFICIVIYTYIIITF